MYYCICINQNDCIVVLNIKLSVQPKQHLGYKHMTSNPKNKKTSPQQIDLKQ
ncbi:hypothetical protein P20429_0429 [Pseudoalteromonas sp. BSi20429]|nr:hypothetical protein P20429_0429 [Pseudoalteromonas sp. BSi20429]